MLQDTKEEGLNLSVGTVKIKIDGVEVSVPEGSTILKAAKDSGIIIPTMCNLEGLTSYGGCRLCLVEVSGSPKLFPACTTPVWTGMEVTTNSDRLKSTAKWQFNCSLPSGPTSAQFASQTTTANSKPWQTNWA